MEITKIVVIVILALLVVVEALIIWALSERADSDEGIHERIAQWRETWQEQVQKTMMWRREYEKQKRQSDHKDRVIQSMYRGEILKKLEQLNSQNIK